MQLSKYVERKLWKFLLARVTIILHSPAFPESGQTLHLFRVGESHG